MNRVTPFLATLALMFAAPAAFALEGDLNNDGAVDQADSKIAMAAVGTTADDPGFLPAADLDGDGVITLVDVGALLKLLGQ